MNQRLQKIGRVGVLMGGSSSEREISLKSGRAVFDALVAAGCDMVALELNTTEPEAVLSLIRGERVDVVFLALHGHFGEDGTVQMILDQNHMAYTGSGPQASHLAMDKSLTQALLKKSGIPVPDFQIVEGPSPDSKEILAALGSSLVVKPACEGSSIGISLIDRGEDLPEALQKALTFGPRVLVEQRIRGKEITCGILNGEALPLIRIRPSTDFFDFTAKYQKGLTEYIIPADVTDEERQKIQSLALRAFRTLDCRDMARVDFMLDEQGRAFVLEINTIPGFTSTSLLPKAAREAGIEFSELCLRLVELAVARSFRDSAKQYA